MANAAAHPAPSPTRRLLLARHGDCGGTGFLGATDLPLEDSGRTQAAALGKALSARALDRICCSPALRCLETARIALPAAVERWEIDPGLREVDFGRWEGLTFDQIARSDGPLVERWARFDADFAFPEGEAVAAFRQRVEQALRRVLSGTEQTTLWFTHGGVIAATLCLALGLQPRQYVLFRVPHASLTTLELYGERGVLCGLGERGQERS